MYLSKQETKNDEHVSVLLPGDRVNAGGGCEAAVTARTRYGWVKLRECGDLLYCRGFAQRFKGAVYMSYVRPAILYGSEAWFLRESEMECYQGQRDPWCEQCVEYSSKIEKYLQI